MLDNVINSPSSYLTDTSLKTSLLQIKFETVDSLSFHSDNLLYTLYQHLQFGYQFFVSKTLADATYTNFTSWQSAILITN